MFTIDQKITDLKVKEKHVLKILFSMNNHQVASPEMFLEEARTYILFFREGKARISVYIALHLLTTDRRLYYSHSSNPFSDDELNAVEEEALGFAEGLGAMLDAIDFTKMSDVEQDRWLDDQDIFSEKPSPEPEAAAPSVAPSTQPELPPAQPTPQMPPPQAPMQQVPATPAAPAAPTAPHVAPAIVVAAPPPPAPQLPVQHAPDMSASLAPRSSKKAGDQSAGVTSAPLAAAARQRELMQQATKAGITKVPKQALNKQSSPAAGIVSRDTEALARLLTSF
jgi:hypothetical protein